MKMVSFRQIPQMSRPGYAVDQSLDMLLETIQNYQAKQIAPLNMEPDFQRIHVWTPDQRTRYVEFILRGGNSSRDIYFNCSGWMGSYEGPFELVDGKQRLSACIGFMEGKVSIFGGYHLDDYDGKPFGVTLRFHINSLKTRKEVLQWYLDINEGGVVHTPDELNKVRELLEAEG